MGLVFYKVLLFIIATVSISILVPASVLAQDPLDEVCQNNPDATLCKERVDDDNPGTGDDGFITAAINILSVITAVVAVIVIIVAGLSLVLSSGDSGSARQARDAIIYAAVGLVVVGIAQLIVSFVVSRVASS